SHAAGACRAIHALAPVLAKAEWCSANAENSSVSIAMAGHASAHDQAGGRRPNVVLWTTAAYASDVANSSAPAVAKTRPPVPVDERDDIGPYYRSGMSHNRVVITGIG